MNTGTRAAAIATTSLAALLALPGVAFAGTKAHSTCTESFARWHNPDIPQPEGGYVTIDFGNDGVDYTTTKWESDKLVGLGSLFPGNTIRIRWYDGSGTLLKTSGNGVAVTHDECSNPTTTTEAPTTTAAPTTTTAAPTTTEAPTTVPVTDPAPTTDPAPVTDPAPTTAVPSTTVVQVPDAPPTVPGTSPATTRVQQAAPTVPTSGLPITGPTEQRNAALGGVAALLTGLFMVRVARRRGATPA